MGAGALRRYRANPESDGYDPNVWRKPNPKKQACPQGSAAQQQQQPPPAPVPTSAAAAGPGGAKLAPSGTAEMAGNRAASKSLQQPHAGAAPAAAAAPQPGRTAVSTAQALQSAHSAWSKPPVASPIAPVNVEEDDEELNDCSNLADLANKVWEELMEKKNNSRGDFNALFCMHEMKAGVERAAKRVQFLNKEAGDASSKLDEKKKLLDDCCAAVEERSTAAGPAVPWKLGDLAVRRGGKGPCEIAMVHHEAEPPYFEVRMHVTGAVVGTEAEKLMALSTSQQSALRKALRDFELAKSEHTKAEEALVSAEEELKQQHQALTAQVEQKLKEDIPTKKSSSSPLGATVPGPPLPDGGPKGKPTGVPEVDVFRKWATSPAPAPVPGPPKHEYPEVKGLKEDLRTCSTASGSPSSGPTEHPGSNASTSKAQAAGDPHSMPNGFPSVDELNRMGQAGHAGAATMSGTYRTSRPGQSSFQTQASGPKVQKDPHRAAATGLKMTPPRKQAAAAGHPHPSAAHAEQQKQEPKSEWVAYSTVDGQLYYHNPSSGETVWHLPPGAKASPAAGQNTYYTASGQQVGSGSHGASDTDSGVRYQQQQQAGPGAEDDPFAELRQQEEQMRQQRDEWTQWYANYCNWYSNQGSSSAAAGGKAAPGQEADQRAGASRAGAAAGGGGGGGGGGGASQQQSGASTKLPPRGLAPPKLDAGFEDKALYAVKSAILKEMESMVDQGAALAQRKKALRVLQMRWHPDKNPDRIEAAKSIFQFLEETKPWFLHEADQAN